MERAAGATFATVVRRCIHCTFDVDKPDLEDPKFYRAVYIGVVNGTIVVRAQARCYELSLNWMEELAQEGGGTLFHLSW